MVGLLGRVISSSQGLYLHSTTQRRKMRTNIHVLSGIRIGYSSTIQKQYTKASNGKVQSLQTDSLECQNQTFKSSWSVFFYQRTWSYGFVPPKQTIESSCRMVSTLVSHSGGPGFESLSGDRYSDWGFRGSPQSLHENARILPLIRTRSLPSLSFPIHHSLIILAFDAT
jgi:hypothetical protein